MNVIFYNPSFHYNDTFLHSNSFFLKKHVYKGQFNKGRNHPWTNKHQISVLSILKQFLSNHGYKMFLLSFPHSLFSGCCCFLCFYGTEMKPTDESVSPPSSTISTSSYSPFPRENFSKLYACRLIASLQFCPSSINKIQDNFLSGKTSISFSTVLGQY